MEADSFYYDIMKGVLLLDQCNRFLGGNSMSRFRFIHASDIHLGSMLHMEGVEDTALLQHCREATYTAFDRVCKAAIDTNARFIVIAGDLYDKESRSVKANRYFAEACQKLNDSGIKVFISAGNHDPIKEYQELFSLPTNVHLFSANEPEVCNVLDGDHIIARVIGQSYQTKWQQEAIHRNFPTLDDNIFNAAMLHTQLVPNDKKYVPCTVSELLENQSINYWALGHIHQQIILRQDKPVIAYSGIPQGRDFEEEGPNGCWLVEVDGTEVIDMKFISTSSVIYKRIEIDIADEAIRDADSINLLEDYIVSCAQDLLYKPPFISNAKADSNFAVNGIVDGYVVKWIISGRGNLHHYLNSDQQMDDLGLCEALRSRLCDLVPFIWTDSVIIRTSSPVTENMLAEHAVLNGLLGQSVDSCIVDEIKRENLISKLGQFWTTSEDHEEQDDLKLTLDQETLKAIIQDAKQLLLESLAEGRD